MSAVRSLRCATHGRGEWTGQVICIDCGRVWHLDVEDPPTKNGKCVCGAWLSGKKGTARAICASCYKAKRTQQTTGPS